jgi:hypothetical protein
MGNKGKREFIQVLRLLEALPLAIVTDAVTQAVQLSYTCDNRVIGR